MQFAAMSLKCFYAQIQGIAGNGFGILCAEFIKPKQAAVVQAVRI
jgi:hypothetical protein